MSPVLTRTVLLALFVHATCSCSSQAVTAEDEPQGTLQGVLKLAGEFVQAQDPNVSPSIVAESEAVIIIPGFRRIGIVLFGAYQGVGLMLARANDGTWSDPIFVYVDGGSVGVQLGKERVDFVLAITSRERLVALMRGTSFGVGAEVTAGRAAASSSTTVNRPDMYLHARSRGALVGFGLRGSTLHVDETANDAFYGNDVPLLEILTGRHRVRSALVEELHRILRQYERS